MCFSKSQPASQNVSYDAVTRVIILVLVTLALLSYVKKYDCNNELLDIGHQ